MISNEEMEDIMKIVKSLDEKSGLLVKGLNKTIENEAKEQKGGFFSMLIGTLSASLLGNLLSGKGAKSKRWGHRVIRAGDGVIQAVNDLVRVGQDF